MCIALVGLIGAGISAAGMIAQGKQAEAMANYQAKALERQATADAQASAYEGMRERHKQELQQAAARAQVGASGVAMTGSPTDVLAANAREGALDVQAIQYGSRLRQGNLHTQAGISRFSGRQARQAANIGAAGAVVGGLYNTYDRAIQMGQNPFVAR